VAVFLGVIDERSSSEGLGDARRRKALRTFMGKLEWWCEEVAPSLETDADLRAVVTVTAAAIRESQALQSRRLGSLLPDFEHLPDTPDHGDFGVRALRRLQRNSVGSWKQLAERSAMDLSAWQDCGTKTVLEILEVSLDEWIEARSPESAVPAGRWYDVVPGAGSPQRSPTVSSEWRSLATSQAMSSLNTFCRVAYRTGASDIGEALELAGNAANATDSAARAALDDSWRRLRALRLDDLLGVERHFACAWSALLDFNERETRILQGRYPTSLARVSCVALGRELDLSGTRVDQIEKRCRATITARIETDDDCAPIAHHAARLRRELGTFVPQAALDAALQPLLSPDARYASLCREILIEQAGPYRLEDGFWQTGHPLSQITAALLERSDAQSTDEQLDRLMDHAGVVVAYREACRSVLSE
jgi:hypothetical protein